MKKKNYLYRMIQRLPLLAIPILLVLATLFISTLSASINSGAGVIPVSGKAESAPAERAVTGIDWDPNGIQWQPQPAIAVQGLAHVCEVPQGWVNYVVAPTDSLFRLAILYNISIEELQAANCMGDETKLMPGQVILIPGSQSAQVEPTPTFVALIPLTSVYSAFEVKLPSDTGSSQPNRPAQPTVLPTVLPTDPPPPPPQPTAQPTTPPSVKPTDPPVHKPIVRPTDPPSDTPASISPKPKPKKDKDENKEDDNKNKDGKDKDTGGDNDDKSGDKDKDSGGGDDDKKDRKDKDDGDDKKDRKDKDDDDDKKDRKDKDDDDDDD